jgi:hypothetical protein
MKPTPLAPEILVSLHGRKLSQAPAIYTCDLAGGAPALQGGVFQEWRTWLEAARGWGIETFSDVPLVGHKPYRIQGEFRYPDPTPGAPICAYNEPWEETHRMVMVGKWRPPLRPPAWANTPAGRQKLVTWYRLSFPMFLLRSLCRKNKTTTGSKMETMFEIYRRFARGRTPDLQLLQEAYALRFLLDIPSSAHHPTRWLTAAGHTWLKTQIKSCGLTPDLYPRGPATEVGYRTFQILSQREQILEESAVVATTVGLLGMPSKDWRPTLAETLPPLWEANRKKYGERHRLAGMFAAYRSVPPGADTRLNQTLKRHIQGLTYHVLTHTYGRAVYKILQKRAPWSALFQHLDLLHHGMNQILELQKSSLRARDTANHTCQNP